MKEIAVKIRNAVIRFGYVFILRPIFFLTDPEVIHVQMVHFGELLQQSAFLKKLTSCFFGYRNHMLRQTVLGIEFENPVGLAAGFDKNGEIPELMASVGFGFTEVGSVTGEPCEGNPKPRLWRLKASKSLLVNYGLVNRGACEVARALGKKKFPIPVGINIAKTNSPDTVTCEAGIGDYAKAFSELAPLASYITVNISCPNAFGGEPFVEPERLGMLLAALDKLPASSPILIKLSPDLTEAQLDAILETAKGHRVHGFICSNLTKDHSNPAIIEREIPGQGGMSGKLVEASANRLIGNVYRKTRGSYVVVGCGGIFSAEDAYKKIRLGASLVQLVTGMIYEGPQLISEINQGLVRLLSRDGYKNISEAVGSGLAQEGEAEPALSI